MNIATTRVHRRRLPSAVLTIMALAAGITLSAHHAHGAITQVTNGFLFAGTNSSLLISDTNGSILSVVTDHGVIASSGEAGLWSLSFSTNSGSGKTSDLNAIEFSSASSSNTFQWSLSPDTNTLFLTYSNQAATVRVTLASRSDGVEMSAAVQPHITNIMALTLPAPLRFTPSTVDRFIAPNHSSDGVGMAYHSSYFIAQNPDQPASWRNQTVGAAGYVSLYGGNLIFGDYVATNITFTTNGVAWLGTALSNKWASATAVVNRPPAPGQADVVLIDSPNGAFLSGSRLGGGAGAGYLMRVGGAVDASRVPLSLDVVAGTIEHLAKTPGGRTKVALLSMVRGPVIGESWPSEVRTDQWRSRLQASGVLASNGVTVVDLTTVPDMIQAMNETNYLAILNPYGELVPSSLTGGVSATVSNIGTFVHGGGHWFEVAGHPFFQALLPELYYTNNILYPPAFADFLQLETTNGNASVYGVQPMSADPWAGATNAASLFVPGRLIWGGDATGGWLQRSFGTFVPVGQVWTSPAVRIALGRSAVDALRDYATANAYARDLDNKIAPSIIDNFKQSVMIHFKGGATQMTARLDDLPAPALLHFEEYLYGGFDKQYPDHLPPNTNFGTIAEFTNFLGQARARGMLTMPYTNPTFWGVDPKGPTFLATNDAPLLLNLDGSINLEVYFGESGLTVTPWHPAVQAANRNTRAQFLTNYPIDVLFHDQIGARTWQYDINPASPTPYAYIAGIAAIAGEDSQLLPVSTENGWDRLINHNAQFAGLAWGLAPTTNAPFWRRYLRERYDPATWEIYPLAQHLAHDKVSFTYNNLDAAVHNHEVMAWTLGLGYGMTYVLPVEDLDDVARRQWLRWIDRMQKSVAARYIGQEIQSFDHHWGTNTVNPDNGVIASGYGDIDVIANLGPQSLTTNGWTLPGYGYLATAPGLVAGHLIPPGESTAEVFVAETNSATEVRFWIYSTGGRTGQIVLPAGYSGTAMVQVETNAPVSSVISNGVLSVMLPASADTLLWSGMATFAAGPSSVFLVDFGRHDGGINGDITTNPDLNGNYWNNIGPTTQAVSNGTKIANMVNVANGASTLGIEMITAGWEANGILNGGLLAPSSALLGELAITNATKDYFFTTVSPSLRISGLETNRTYDLTFFGTRETTTTRITTYTVGAISTNLQTSGTAIGDGGYNGNNNKTVTLSDLVPNASGQIDVTLSVNAGGFAYLGIMKIEEFTPAPPAVSGATTQAVYRIDFGRHDGGVNGTATTSPDTNGNFWNNIGPTTEAVPNGTTVANLVNITNGTSSIDISTITTGWKSNGKLNGGLLSPSPALLGDLAIATATEDYFFTQGTDTFRISSLDPSRRYNLRFFGTRENTATRITTYTSGFASTNLQTSGIDIGDSGYDGNNNKTVTLAACTPNPSGEIDITVSVQTGGFAYLGILEIEEYIPAVSTNPGPSILASPGSLVFVATNGASNPSAQTFAITNSGIGTLNFQLATNAGWLSVSPISGSLAAGAGQTITVSVNATGQPLGIANALILINDPAATNNPQYINVSLQVKSDNPLLAIFGSSVAKGWNSSGQFADPDVYIDGGSWSNGYAALMTLLLNSQGGPLVTNVSTPGDNTAAGLSKYDSRVVPLSPTYVLIAYSLGNEGLAGSTDPTSSNIVATFTANLWNLVGKCRTNGFIPIISSVYPHGSYTPDNYAHLKRMHLTINSWDVPSLNLLTPVDDGVGQWIDGYWSDAAHPNDAGYNEFFLSFVPSLFDAIEAGKTNRPAFGSPTNFARLSHNASVNTPLTFTPSNTVHSFTTSFRLRTTDTGTIAAVRSGANYSTLELRAGSLVYINRSGGETAIATNLADGIWHDVALSSRYALSNTAVYVDGVLAGSIAEQYVPDQFILGGPGASGRAATPSTIDLDNWCLYRAGWTIDEALAHQSGNLQQSSMELGVMLDDAAFTNGTAAANVAQSLSVAVVNTPDLAAWNEDIITSPTVLIFGSSVAKGWNGGGAITNGSFALGYAGRLTPILETTGWYVTNASIGGNNTTSLLARFDTDAVPVNPDIIVIGLSLGNEGLLGDSDAAYESFRVGMTNLIHRSRTNGFYPVITHVYPHTAYTTNHYAYVKRMNLLLNSWDVPGINLLGPVDDGVGKWVTAYRSDDAHPNTAGHEEMFYAIVPTLFDAILAGHTNTPQLAGTFGYARLQGAEAQPFTFTPSSTMHSFNSAFRVRAGYTGTVASVMTATSAPPSASPATFLIDFGRHDGGINGTATVSPDVNGNYWNNISPANPETNTAVLIGAAINNMITISNAATSVRLEITSSGWTANGILNGGLLSPSNSLLGKFAIGTATEDYFFHSTTGTFKIAGLNPSSTYTLRFFGTRLSAETRISTFTVGSASTNHQTSGVGIGTYVANQNDDEIAELAGLSPNGSGEISVTMARAGLSFAHLGILEIVETPAASVATGGSIELRDNSLVYVATNGTQIVAPVDADDGSWIDVALSHSYARGLTMLYIDGVLAGTVAEQLVPVQFVLGGPGQLTDRPSAPTEFDLQDWCLYRAPWTPDEAMAQHTGALQRASMELCLPLDDAAFLNDGSASNRAQSLALASITGTNITAGVVVLPPGNLQAVSPAYNTVSLSWSDNSGTESGFAIERRLAGLGGFWSNRTVVAANTTNHTEFSVAAGTYEYRVSALEGMLQSDYSGVATVTVSEPAFSAVSPISTFQFAGGLTSISFIGSNAVVYILQYTTNLLNPAGWQPVITNGTPALVIGNGTDTKTLSDTNQLDGIRTYRLTSAP